jgi:excisionase family DNA binding protein
MSQVQQSAVTPMVLTVAQVAQELQLSRAKVYQLIHLEGLPTVPFGSTLRVRREALQRWIELREKHIV